MALKILVVEDDLPTLEMMHEVLRPFNVQVASVADGEAASAIISKQKFDGIFLDLMLPKVDGFEVARRIRKSTLNKATPIVVVTGSDSSSTIDAALAAGADFFIRKPIDKKLVTILLNETRGAILENRRRFRRVSVDMDVTCQAESRVIKGRSWNVSEGGLLFQGDPSLQVGTRVQLSFRMPKQPDLISAKGIVVRTDQEHRVGIEFTSLRSTDRERIRIFVSDQAPAA